MRTMGWYCTRCGHEAPAGGACPRDGEVLARVSSHDLHGRTLGEYRILATLGGGSYGSVYRAIHTRSGMLVAIKLLHRPIDDVESKRVLVEARAAAQIDHPNVAKVYDLAMTSDRRPYIVMQLLDGKPLSALIAQRLDVGTALSVARDVLAALAAAHGRGVIHRDLKPDNIFVTKGRALIVDFGLAKLVADPRSPSLTATGEAIGTPHYMAPEQVRGEPADLRADLYAVGCVLFEMLAGRPPFEGTSTYVLFDAHLHQPPVSIASLRPDIPPVIELTIARALAKDARDRFASAADMQRALASTTPPKRRSRAGLIVGAAAALAAIVAIGLVIATRDRAEAVADTPEPRRTFTVPPPALGDPPIDPKLEDSLQATAAMLSRGLDRRQLVMMRCGIQTPIAPQLPGDLRAYLRRAVALLDQALPDFNEPKDCAPPPPTAKRFSKPEPLPDEGKLDPQFESVIDTIHDQLESGVMTAQQARDMHCQFVRQAEDAVAQGGLLRGLRGMNRRIEVLLEAYHPGSIKARCR
jgi:hypothetical protein